MIKRTNCIIVLLFLLCFSLLGGCADREKEWAITVTDSDGNTVGVDAPPVKVVALQASIGAVWELAGGKLLGISDDYANYGMELNDKTIIGTNHNPNIETIQSLSPDLVLYSSKLSTQVAAAKQLQLANIPTYAVSVESFDEYLITLKNFCTLTNSPENYALNGDAVRSRILDIIGRIPKNATKPTAIMLRATSTNLFTVSGDNFVIDILNDLGVNNIAASRTNLEVVNQEYVVGENPEYIFVTVMGKNSAETASKLNENYFDKPAWKNLSAVKNGKVIVLPSDLFVYKPNADWDKSYDYVYETLYGG